MEGRWVYVQHLSAPICDLSHQVLRFDLPH
jgi:hypothetical protein